MHYILTSIYHNYVPLFIHLHCNILFIHPSIHPFIYVIHVSSNSSYIIITIIFIIILITAPESYPRDFMITAIELRSLTFLWKPVDKCLQNGLIINYTITCNSSSILPMEISPDVLIEDSNGMYNYTIFGFTPATVYMCSIYANTSVGAGPEISAIGITLEESKFKLLYYILHHFFIHYIVFIKNQHY